MAAPQDPKTSCFAQCEGVAKLCTLTADQCLADLRVGRGDNVALATLHWVLSDCREFARLNAENVLRGSWFLKSSCEACADICRRCAGFCEKLDSEHKGPVIEALRNCSTACLELAGQLKARPYPEGDVA